jgi:hypothetical protein
LWCAPVIPATQEEEAVQEKVGRLCLRKKIQTLELGHSSVVEYLSSIYETSGSNPSTVGRKGAVARRDRGMSPTQKAEDQVDMLF